MLEPAPTSPPRGARRLAGTVLTFLAGVGTAMLAAPLVQAVAVAVLAHERFASWAIVIGAFLMVGVVSLSAYGALEGGRRRGVLATAVAALTPFATLALVLAAAV